MKIITKTKAALLIIPAALLFTFISFSSHADDLKEVPRTQLIKRGDLLFKVDSETPFTGKSVGFWPNGQKMFEDEFINGMPHGKWIGWREDGRLFERGRIYKRQTAWKNGFLAQEWKKRFRRHLL